MNVVSKTARGPVALHYVEGPAAGPPLLLLHGVGRAWQDYETLLPALLPRWHVFALDHRGHGNSGRAKGDYFVIDYVRDAAEQVRQHAATPAVLYGHSLGAMAAMAVAAELPDRVAGLILEDPPFHTMGRHIAGTPWLPLFCGLREIARQGGSEDVRARKLADLAVPAPDGGTTTLGARRTRQSLEFSARCLATTDPEVFTPVIDGCWLDGYDEEDLFRKIQCPVLLLHGDPDTGAALTERDAQRALSTIPNCRRVSFPGVGHLIHQDQPERIVRLIEEFAVTLEPVAPAPLAFKETNSVASP